jgi:hypothetical protein
MDKTVPVFISLAAYTCVALVISLVVRPPKDLKDREAKDFLGQHLSIVHAYVAIFLSLSVYIYEGGVDYNAPTDFLHLLVLAVHFTQNSFGYFIFDSIYGEYYKVHDTAFRFHHAFALTGLTTMYSVCNSYIVGVFLAEVSNPCVLKRHILRAKGLEESFAYGFYENVFVALFVITRAVIGMWYLCKVWASLASWMYLGVASSIFAVSWFWLFVIATKAVKRFSGTSNPVMKKVLAGMKKLRTNKALLLVVVLVISFGLPAMVANVSEDELLGIEIEGFSVI